MKYHPVVVVKTLVNRHSAPVLQMLKKFLTPAPFHTHVLFFFSLFQCSQGEKESQSCDESHISGPEKICAKPEKKVVALLLLFKRLVFLLQCWLYLQTIVYHDLLKSDDGIIDNIMQRRCSGSPFGHKKHALD